VARADDAPIAPLDIARAVNDLFANRGRMPVATDTGDCLFTALEIENTELVAPGYYATMGSACLRASASRQPRAAAVILVGDGAFQMTGWELGNCRRYGWTDRDRDEQPGWEMLRVFQPESRFNDLDDWNFAELAAPLGGDGVRVRHAPRIGNGARGGSWSPRPFPAHRSHDPGRQRVADARRIRRRPAAAQRRAQLTLMSGIIPQ